MQAIPSKTSRKISQHIAGRSFLVVDKDIQCRVAAIELLNAGASQVQPISDCSKACRLIKAVALGNCLSNMSDDAVDSESPNKSESILFDMAIIGVEAIDPESGIRVLDLWTSLAGRLQSLGCDLIQFGGDTKGSTAEIRISKPLKILELNQAIDKKKKSSRTEKNMLLDPTSESQYANRENEANKRELNNFIQLLESSPKEKRSKSHADEMAIWLKKTLLKAQPFLSEVLTTEICSKMCAAARVRHIQAGCQVQTFGNECNHWYMLLKGYAEICNYNPERTRRISSGATFGENGLLLQNRLNTSSVVSLGDVNKEIAGVNKPTVLFQLHRKDYNKSLGTLHRDRDIIKIVLRKLNSTSNTSEESFQKEINFRKLRKTLESIIPVLQTPIRERSEQNIKDIGRCIHNIIQSSTNRILEDLPLTSCEHLACLTHCLTVNTGDILFRKGEPVTKLYMTMLGSIKLTRKNGISLTDVAMKMLRVGTLIGASSIKQQYSVHAYTATAEGNRLGSTTIVAVIDMSSLAPYLNSFERRHMEHTRENISKLDRLIALPPRPESIEKVLDDQDLDGDGIVTIEEMLQGNDATRGIFEAEQQRLCLTRMIVSGFSSTPSHRTEAQQQAIVGWMHSCFKSSPAFEEIPTTEECLIMSNSSKLLTLNAFDTLASRGDDPKYFYIILSGQIAVLKQKGNNANASRKIGSLGKTQLRIQKLRYSEKGQTSHKIFRKAKPELVNLSTAIQNGDLYTIKKLLKAGANVNERDTSSGDTLGRDLSSNLSTPLIHAARVPNNTSIIICLMKWGADPRLIDADKNTCLHVLAGGGHIKSLEYLMMYQGIEEIFSWKNRDKKTPQDILNDWAYQKAESLTDERGKVKRCKAGEVPLFSIGLFERSREIKNSGKKEVLMYLDNDSCIGTREMFFDICYRSGLQSTLCPTYIVQVPKACTFFFQFEFVFSYESLHLTIFLTNFFFHKTCYVKYLRPLQMQMYLNNGLDFVREICGSIDRQSMNQKHSNFIRGPTSRSKRNQLNENHSESSDDGQINRNRRNSYRKMNIEKPNAQEIAIQFLITLRTPPVQRVAYNIARLAQWWLYHLWKPHNILFPRNIASTRVSAQKVALALCRRLSKVATIRTYSRGDKITQSGHSVNEFCMIYRGHVSCKSTAASLKLTAANNLPSTTLKLPSIDAGQTFGDIALLRNRKYFVTRTATRHTSVVVVPFEDWSRELKKIQFKILKTEASWLRRLSLFKDISIQDMGTLLISCFQIREFKKGDILVERGSIMNSVFLIRYGVAKGLMNNNISKTKASKVVSPTKKKNNVISPGDEIKAGHTFGQNSCIQQRPVTCGIITHSESLVAFEISKESLILMPSFYIKLLRMVYIKGSELKRVLRKEKQKQEKAKSKQKLKKLSRSQKQRQRQNMSQGSSRPGSRHSRTQSRQSRAQSRHFKKLPTIEPGIKLSSFLGI